MGQVIIKPERETDFYIIWSDNVDAPVAFGTRASLMASGGPVRTAENFDRADANSSSSYRFPESWGKELWMIFQNSGTIPRSRMIELCKRLDPIWDDLYGWYRYPQIIELLDPLDDEDDE